MLQEAQKRKIMEPFQFQSLRDVLKVEDGRMKEFVTKYCEVKVQTSRKKVTETMFMGSENLSRHIYQNSRVRRDLVGQDFFQESCDRKDSRGQDFVTHYYRPVLEPTRLL